MKSSLRLSKVFKHFTNKFVILLVVSLLFSMYMSKPASSLIMVEYKLGNLLHGIETRPRDITVGYADSSGFRWVAFTEQFPGRIGVIDRSNTPGHTLNTITELILPQNPPGVNPEPWGLAFESVASPGLWYTDIRQNLIGRVTISYPSSHGLVTYNIPTPDSQPRGISVQSSSNSSVWFTEYRTGKIGCLNYDGSLIVEWQLPNPNSQPNDIIVVGDTVYFTELGIDRIGAYNMSGLRPQGQSIKEFKLPSGSAPWSLTADNNGMIWFTCSGRNVIGVLNPYTGEVTEHRSIPTDNSQPHGIAFDNVTGSVWFTEYQGHKITKYVPTENLFYEYPTLTAGSAPNDVTIQRYGSDNQTVNGVADVWFTEYAGNRIGLISQAGPMGNLGTLYGATSTTTVTTATTAVSATYSAASSTTTTTRGIDTPATGPDDFAGTITVSATTTNATTQTQTETAYRLSTSTLGTSTSFIVEVAYTSVTATSTSTTYVSTTSVTSSTTFTSTSTSYIGTTSITSTSTSWVTVYTGTVSRTSTSTLSIPNTLTTTVTETKYKTTTSGTTSTTSTQTVSLASTATMFATVPTTISGTTTSTRTTTTFTIPPLPKCVIASAAYGDPNAPEVVYMRYVRDNLVGSSNAGKILVEGWNSFYYSWSPTLAELAAKSNPLRLLLRLTLTPLRGIIHITAVSFNIFAPLSRDLASLVAFLLAAVLSIGVYIAPPILVTVFTAKRVKSKMSRRR